MIDQVIPHRRETTGCAGDVGRIALILVIGNGCADRPNPITRAEAVMSFFIFIILLHRNDSPAVPPVRGPENIVCPPG